MFCMSLLTCSAGCWHGGFCIKRTPNMTSLFGFWWHFDVTGQAPNVTSETLIKQTLSHTCSACHWCLAQPVADVADFAVNAPKLTSLYGFVGFTKAPRQVKDPDVTSETLEKNRQSLQISHACSACYGCLAQHVADMASFLWNEPNMTSLDGFCWHFEIAYISF